ncbi:hypothetical protein MIC448_1140010 [Microbacterium sp. C448]|uniref:hypothetical protein n=1 Tax=Microbacterium sp. C448 TaxID=1177594 RepID=UPI0003DE363D|nr:hypothetical protein [Microbacterium sp. C448]CDJ99056.1 hypothetical protein MIC448_1140010 [Microbacterium sp. C448]
MVDARLPAEWLGSLRIDKLSDRAFRVLAGALMWCNGQGTDGAIPARYTKYLHPDGDDQDAFDELEASGLWSRAEDGYLLAGWSHDLRQSTAEEIQRYRDAARQRQKAYRDRQRQSRSESGAGALSDPRAMRDLTHNATRQVTANVGSGSLGETTRKSAYVTRNVRRHADSPFCAKHPAGTSDPCGACARARTAHEAHQNTIPGLGRDCAVDGHKLVVDGTCAVCAYRPRPTAA